MSFIKTYARCYQRLTTIGNVQNNNQENSNLLELNNENNLNNSQENNNLEQNGTYEPDLTYVDLGLPSGTLWSSYNLGASENNLYGNYYMYGIITPYNSEDTPYQGAENPLSSEHDAATAIYGLEWNTPTKDQVEELFLNTTHIWVSDYEGTGISGVVFTNQLDSSAKIFIPAAGAQNSQGHSGLGTNVQLHTSTPAGIVEGGYVYTARIYDSEGPNLQWNPDGQRYLGYSIRPVITPILP